MDTMLATVQAVRGLSPIPHADAIEVADILGWKVVVKKGEFKVGDLGIYCQIDTILPDKPEFEFLRKVNFRIKTVRLRKQLSQGIFLPLSVLPAGDYKEGQDVTRLIGIKKYEKPVPVHFAKQIAGSFPSCVPKTDEIMIQSVPKVIEEMKGRQVYITTKCDGTSATYLDFNGQVYVCSRNLSLKENADNVYWKVFYKYKMGDVLAKNAGMAIQGEICGPSIQKNRLGLKDHELFVFQVYDVAGGKYLDYEDFCRFCEINGLKTVPVDRVCTFDFDIPQLLEMAKGKYPSGQNREGIVIRPVIEAYSPVLDEYSGRPRLSIKVLNNDYLEKDEQ